MASRPSSLLLLASLVIPATALLLPAYLYNHPLPAKKSRSIRTSEALSPPHVSSSSLKIVNPESHSSFTDSYSITLSKSEVKDLSDEQILARFMRGFFGGWIFTPESYLISFLGVFGRKMIPVGFSDIPTNGPIILSPLELSRETLPPEHTILFGGNFMVLDVHVGEEASLESRKETAKGGTFIEIGFGDNRKRFAGFHRFDVLHSTQREGVEIYGSHISCNPTGTTAPFPSWFFGFHKFYATCLFRDGVREILR